MRHMNFFWGPQIGAVWVGNKKVYVEKNMCFFCPSNEFQKTIFRPVKIFAWMVYTQTHLANCNKQRIWQSQALDLVLLLLPAGRRASPPLKMHQKQRIVKWACSKSTETQKELYWPKTDSKVTPADRSQSDLRVTQKWIQTPLLSHFWVTFVGACAMTTIFLTIKCSLSSVFL